MVPDLMEGTGGIMKSFGQIIQDRLLFEGSGIMKISGDRNQKWLKAQHSALKQNSKASLDRF